MCAAGTDEAMRKERWCYDRRPQGIWLNVFRRTPICRGIAEEGCPDQTNQANYWLKSVSNEHLAVVACQRRCISHQDIRIPASIITKPLQGATQQSRRPGLPGHTLELQKLFAKAGLAGRRGPSAPRSPVCKSSRACPEIDNSGRRGLGSRPCHFPSRRTIEMMDIWLARSTTLTPPICIQLALYLSSLV